MLPKKISLLLPFLILLISSTVFAADTTQPSTTLVTDPISPNGENGWYTTYPTVTLNSEDTESGISSINWKINDGNWQSQSFFSGLNLVQNPSFEQGYIYNWHFNGSFPSVGIKSSFRKYTGNFSAVIITLGRGQSYWESTSPIEAQSYKTYTYSFYATSFTSWLDNGFYEIVLVDNGIEDVVAQESVVISEEELDLKFNFKKYSGVFTLGEVSPNAYLYIKIGLNGIGHIGLDEVYISQAGENSSVNFNLNQEGVNTVQYYSVDGAGNTEGTKSTQIKIDTQPPFFSNFGTFNQDTIQKFASRIDVEDLTSKLVATPSLFNYAVDGFTNGYYEDPGVCGGNFLENEYLDLSTDFSNGDTLGTVSTSQIDYCDTNWVNCKRLNFFVKDLAGNIGNRSICINGPYIGTLNGNVFGRSSIYQMGLGDADNVEGVATSTSFITDISSTNNFVLQNYSDFPYMNNVYSYYTDALSAKTTQVTSIDESDGVYLVDDNYTISSDLPYIDSSQIVFINGDLTIESNITSTDSSVFYIVNGDITINNNVTALQVNLISSNQIFTSDSVDISEKLEIKGSLIAQDLVFSRNTDRTLGASEIIELDPFTYFNKSDLELNPIYWREVYY